MSLHCAASTSQLPTHTPTPPTPIPDPLVQSLVTGALQIFQGQLHYLHSRVSRAEEILLFSLCLISNFLLPKVEDAVCFESILCIRFVSAKVSPSPRLQVGNIGGFVVF